LEESRRESLVAEAAGWSWWIISNPATPELAFSAAAVEVGGDGAREVGFWVREEGD
jgi:hypothetical protein